MNYIALLSLPIAIAANVASAQYCVLVADDVTNELVLINGTNHRVANRIPTEGASDVAVAKSTGTGVVVGGSTITFVDLSSGEILTTASLADEGLGVAVSADEQFAYVAGNAAGIEKFEIATGEFVTSTPASRVVATNVHAGSDTSDVYAVGAGSGSVWKLDSNSLSIQATILLEDTGAGAVLFEPRQFITDATSTFGYIALARFDGSDPNTPELSGLLIRMSLAGFSPVGAGSLGPGAGGMAFDASESTLFVNNAAETSFAGRVSRIAPESVEATGQIEGAGGGDDLALSPDGTLLYATSPEGIDVIEVASGAVVDRIESVPTSGRIAIAEIEQGCEGGEVATGDCDGSGDVTVDEIIRGVNIALGTVSVDDCLAFDADDSGTVTVDEILQAIQVALTGAG